MFIRFFISILDGNHWYPSVTVPFVYNSSTAVVHNVYSPQLGLQVVRGPGLQETGLVEREMQRHNETLLDSIGD
jgi:hypothetical protein